MTEDLWRTAYAVLYIIMMIIIHRTAINCDHSGNETSDELLKRKGREGKKNTKQGSNTKVPLILKILIGLISVPVIAFNIILLSVFIKSLIQMFG